GGRAARRREVRSLPSRAIDPRGASHRQPGLGRRTRGEGRGVWGSAAASHHRGGRCAKAASGLRRDADARSARRTRRRQDDKCPLGRRAERPGRAKDNRCAATRIPELSGESLRPRRRPRRAVHTGGDAMSDPDRINDTEPTGCPLATDEGPDADADEATEPNDAPREDVAAGVSEHDTDDFLRWLPTLALGHRRRAELVERSSSDGADFAAYACEGRPAATSGQARIESAVKVQPARGSKDLERDAPTVLTGERRARPGGHRVGRGALGVAAAGAALAGWAERPVVTEKALQRGEAVATAPMPMGPIPTQQVEAAEPRAAPPPTPLQATPTDVARTTADQRDLSSSAAAADAARKRDSAGTPKPLPSSARRRAGPLASAPTLAAKDQYFEE